VLIAFNNPLPEETFYSEHSLGLFAQKLASELFKLIFTLPGVKYIQVLSIGITHYLRFPNISQAELAASREVPSCPIPMLHFGCRTEKESGRLVAQRISASAIAGLDGIIAVEGNAYGFIREAAVEPPKESTRQETVGVDSTQKQHSNLDAHKFDALKDVETSDEHPPEGVDCDVSRVSSARVKDLIRSMQESIAAKESNLSNRSISPKLNPTKLADIASWCRGEGYLSKDKVFEIGKATDKSKHKVGRSKPVRIDPQHLERYSQIHTKAQQASTTVQGESGPQNPQRSSKDYLDAAQDQWDKILTSVKMKTPGKKD
jgi:hypothetical protein